MPKTNFIIEKSIFVSWLRRFSRSGERLFNYISSKSKDSLIYRLLMSARNKFKIYYTDSNYYLKFRLAVKAISYPIPIRESRFTNWVRDWSRILKDLVHNTLSSSHIFGSKQVFKDPFILTPVRTISFILLSYIFFNLFLVVILRKSISLYGFIFRYLFFFLAFGGIFCDASWQNILETRINYSL